MVCNHQWEKSKVHGYLQCAVCKTYRLESMPDLDIYKQDYWSHQNNRSTLDEQVNNLTWEFDGKSKLEAVMQYVGGGNKALEIGCAPGIMLQKLADTHVMAFGIEVDPKNFPEIRRIANRPNVRLWEGFFPYDFFGLKSDLFDTVVAMDVLEHVDDPDWFVAKCAEMLQPNGRLIVMTPTIQPGAEGKMPERMWNTEEHIWVFSLDHIMSIFKENFDMIEFSCWVPGHEIIVGRNKKKP